MEKLFQTYLTTCLKEHKTKIALSYKDHFLSFGELDYRSDLVAKLIKEKKIAKGTFIGIFIENLQLAIISLIGIIKSGCVFVPLETSLPWIRLQQLIKTVNLTYCLSDKNSIKKVENITHCNIETIDISTIQYQDVLPDFYLNQNNINYSQQDEIYVYFTSGSTGSPKAVVGKNVSLLQYVIWHSGEFGFKVNDRFSQMANFGFDAFIKELFVSIFTGGCLVIPPNLFAILQPQSFKDWFEKNAINVMHCVPSVFRVLLKSSLIKSSLKNLKWVLLSGERIVPIELNKWYDLFGNRKKIVNLYGTTETTILRSFYEIQPLDVERSNIPIGKPIKGSQFIILDENMSICDKGSIGEIFIRSPYHSYGYFNDKEANDKVFIANPFNSDINDLLYRTGDIGRELVDGNFELLGRVDRQIKIRGVRIELEEIENCIIKTKGVTEVAVIKNESDIENEQLVAFYTLSSCLDVKNEEIHNSIIESLNRTLPSYMVPTVIRRIKEFPRLQNRKVNYKELSSFSREEKMDSPTNNIEIEILRIWKSLFKNNQISVNDSFFELGGNSLNVISLQNILYKRFKFQMTLSQIFENQTIRQQSRLVLSKKSEISYKIKKTEKKQYYPLSPSQERMFYYYFLDPSNLVYNMPMLIELPEDIDFKKYNDVFNKLIKRHEILRTSFRLENHKPVQIIHKEFKYNIEYYQAKSNVEQDEFIQMIEPFDLEKLPLFRIKILKGFVKKYLFFDMHHIIGDGISNILFIKEFNYLLGNKRLPDLCIQYKDVSNWLVYRYLSQKYIEMEKYWLNKLARPLSKVNLPTDFKRSETTKLIGNSLYFNVSSEKTQQLNRMANEYNTTLFILLLSIYNILLSKLSGQNDIIIGTPVSGRLSADFINMMGNFINSIVLRNHPNSDLDFSEFLKITSKNTIEDLNHQDYQFDDLVSKLQLSGKQDENPIYNISFGMQNQNTLFSSEANEADVLNISNIKNSVSHFDLLLLCSEENGLISCCIEYNTKLFLEESIDTISKYFLCIIDQVLEYPNISIGNIKLDESQNGIESSYSKSTPIVLNDNAMFDF